MKLRTYRRMIVMAVVILLIISERSSFRRVIFGKFKTRVILLF